MIIDLQALRERAGEVADGYLQECLAAGAVRASGLVIAPDVYAVIKAKYSGLGDIVAAVAKPTAKVIDAILGTHFASCAGCQKRQRNLNVLTTAHKVTA